MTKLVMDNGYIDAPGDDMLQDAIEWAIEKVK